MSSNTENTEAKLAAYIDGQLDAAERAQIEQYLAANPEHQKLLADMAAQREVLRGLPREKAPADIYDSLQAQLERSILLDDSGAGASAAVRHSRRSQLFGIAAILLLAVGLGGVLYFALLPSRRANVADVTTTTMPMAAPPATTNEADKGPAVGQGGALAEGPAGALREKVISNARVVSPTGQAIEELQRGGGVVVTDATQPTVVQGGADSLLVLVSTDDPSKANRQVADFLASNNIRWETVNGVTDQAPASGELKSMRQALQSEAAVQNVPAAVGAAPEEKDGDGTASTRSSGAVAQKQAAGGQQQGLFANKELEGQPYEPSQQVHQEQLEKVAVDAARWRSGLSAAQQRAVDSYFASISKDSTSQVERPGKLIIARGMTRQQAAELTDTLSTEAPAQRARLILRDVSVASGDLAPVRRQLDRQAYGRAKASTQPATQPQQQAAVSEVTAAAPTTVPTAEAAPSAAPTTAESVEVAKKAEVVAEDGERVTAGAVAGTTTAPVSTTEVAAAATQPTTRPEQAVDVVILVQDEAKAPATEPAATEPAASQPAAAPPASQPKVD